MRHQQTEVLVVGAGPVGMLTTLLLAQEGIHTRLIDQESRAAGHSYACALHPASLALLDQVGVAEDAIQLGHRVNKIIFYDGGQRHTELDLGELPGNYPFLLVLDQGRLEDLLEEKLRQTAGVTVDWNHRLTGLVMDEHGVAATVDKLAATGKGYIIPYVDLTVQKSHAFHAQFVVGADGHNSLVRQLLDISYEPAGARELFAVYEAESDESSGDEMKIVFDRATTSVLWPFSDGQFRWSFQIVPAEPLEDFPGKERSRLIISERPGDDDRLHRLQRLLRERAPWFDPPLRQVDWSTNIQFERRLASRFGRDRCWLAGDAAHQTGPVGMQSMNQGLHEAADLAGALRRILHEHGSRDLLEAYNATHLAEWRLLLGLRSGPVTNAGATEWARRNCVRILSCLPASGHDLAALLDRVGLELEGHAALEA